MIKKRLLSIGIVALFVTTICGILFYYVGKGLNDWTTNDPRDYPLQTAESMLQAIALQTFEPESWQMAEKVCQESLQPLMTRNKNQYTLVVAGVFGDHGTPIAGTGTDAVLLHIIFPDHSRVELYFYGAILIDCKQIADTE